MAVTPAPLPSPAPGGPRVSAGGLAARATVVLGAVVVAVAAGPPAALLLPLALGVALAIARPDRIGAWVALPAAVLLVAVSDDLGPGGAVLAALGVYLLHTGAAATAVVPLGAVVPAAVGRRWLRRCLPAVVATGVVAGLDAVVGETPRSTAFAVVAVASVLLAAVALARLLTRAVRAGH